MIRKSLNKFVVKNRLRTYPKIEGRAPMRAFRLYGSLHNSRIDTYYEIFISCESHQVDSSHLSKRDTHPSLRLRRQYHRQPALSNTVIGLLFFVMQVKNIHVDQKEEGIFVNAPV